ncbi:MAG: hypothetical protein U1F14_07375 [Steroidobacteraceae bacterium]
MPPPSRNASAGRSIRCGNGRSLHSRANHNKATCALANKLARICFATLRDHAPYGAAPAPKKLTRQAFPMPA